MKTHSFGVPRVWALIFAVLLASMTSLSRAAETYSVGVVPQFDARRVQAIWQPILTEVAKRSGVQLELVGSPDIPQFETQLMAGEFDFAYMNPYHLIKAHTGQGYSPLVRDVGRTLYGIVVVRKDSPIQRVEELDGKLIAFPAPNALGASLIPRAEFSETYKINIQPRYVRSHGSVYLNVVTGETAAGGGVQKTLQQQPENIRNALRIVYKTSEVAPHPFAAHPRVPAAVRERIRQAFLQLGGTNEGQALLTKIPAKIIGPASLEDYQALRTMGLDKYYVE